MLEIAKIVVEWVLKDVLSPLLTWLFDPKNWPWPALPVFLILTASVGIVVIAVVGLGEPSGCQLTPVPQNIAFLEKFEEFKDCACCPPMVVLPHGSYQMGKHVNEADNKECAISDAKLVEIDKTFAMSKYEIRVKEFRAFK